MFWVTGHARSTGSTAYQVDAALPLFVNCCGYQHFTSRDFSIQRPTGRLDYQILYIHKGCGHFFLNNRWEIVPAGNIVVYLQKRDTITGHFLICYLAVLLTRLFQIHIFQLRKTITVFHINYNFDFRYLHRNNNRKNKV